jgi:ornithine cyclodeaminase/alanine dehydrogenase-like protein (mu-crystallin family)
LGIAGIMAPRERHPVLSHDAVLAAVSPEEAIARTRDAFVRHHAREWSMPPKVYLESPGHGDFRAMPGARERPGDAQVDLVVPGNPDHGLPTVMGVVVLSDAATSAPVALLDARSVTALRTGAVAAVASRALARDDARRPASSAAGCTAHGPRAAWPPAGYGPGRVQRSARRTCAQGARRRARLEVGDRAAALACDVVCCVTPGAEPVVDVGDLRPGLHLNMLGATARARRRRRSRRVIACSLFCDEWAQASHGGELTAAVEQGLVTRDLVTDLGAVLAGEAAGRPHAGAVTLFDSTGLAIQDLAIAGAAYHAWRAGDVAATTVEL